MKKQELCFIGAGLHATNNIFPSALLAGADIAAVSTRHLEGAKDALRRFGSMGRAYDDYQVMLREELCKNVVIVTQAPDTPALVCDCLQAGKNVFTDKPLGLNLHQAIETAAIAKENGVQLMVGFMKRYAPVYMRLKQLIDSQELGRVHSFRALFAVDATSWNKSKEGFVFLVIIHYLDLIRHLFGEVEELCGFESGNGADGLSQCISVRCKNGVVGSIAFENHNAWSREYETMDVTFEGGFARAEDLTKFTLHRSSTGKDMPWRDLSEKDEVFVPFSGPVSGTTRDLYLRGFVGEMEHFLTCCEYGRTPCPDGEDNINTTQLCERVLQELK